MTDVKRLVKDIRAWQRATIAYYDLSESDEDSNPTATMTAVDAAWHKMNDASMKVIGTNHSHAAHSNFVALADALEAQTQAETARTDDAIAREQLAAWAVENETLKKENARLVVVNERHHQYIQKALGIEARDEDTGHRAQDDEAIGWNECRDVFRAALSDGRL